MAKSAEQLALEEYLKAGETFTEGGAPTYSTGNPLDYTKLGPLDQQGPSAYASIETDPEFQEHQMEALRQLEVQSKDGYSARDKADLARIESSANRANQGRQGAIRQSMQSRGIAGGGLEVVMQQQAAQDAAEQQALAGLEKNAQLQDRKQSATSQLGALSMQMQGQQFGQQAQIAGAKDAITKFNIDNSNKSKILDNQGTNQTSQANWERGNSTSDKNVQAGYDYRKDALGVQQGGAKVKFDAAAAAREAAEQRARDRKAKSSGMAGAVTGAALGGAGAYFGGSAGASAGYGIGNSLGQNFAHGGTVKGPEITPFDDPANDIIPATVSAGEIVLPKSVASDPAAAAQFVANEKIKSGLDPRILERLAGKNPDLVNKYKAQMSGAQSGVDDAERVQTGVDYAGVIGKGLTDFNNSQKGTYRTGVTFDNMAGKVQRDAPSVFDNSGAEGLAKSSAERAQDKLAEIKAAMAAEAKAQREGDQFTLGRADRAEDQTESARRYDETLQGQKDARDQSAKQAADALAEAKRSHLANEGLERAKKAASENPNDPLAFVPKDLRDNYVSEKGKHDNYQTAISAVTPIIEKLRQTTATAAIPGTDASRDYESLKANAAVSLMGKVDGIRSDADFKNLVEPLLPRPTDSQSVADTKAKQLMGLLESFAPSRPVADTYKDPRQGNAPKQGGIVHGADLPD